jgi:hypothetical protein
MDCWYGVQVLSFTTKILAFQFCELLCLSGTEVCEKLICVCECACLIADFLNRSLVVYLLDF